jgi:hypothetical protein
MTQFIAEPIRTLSTKEELLDFLSVPTRWDNEEGPMYARESWGTKSVFLISIIDGIVATGKFPYNSDVRKEAERQLGIPEQDENNSILSRLVYMAQRYRDHDNLVRDGYSRLTQEMIEQAYREDKRIQLIGENIVGGVATSIYNPREIGGKVYLMKPKTRKYGIRPDNQPAKIVEAK